MSSPGPESGRPSTSEDYRWPAQPPAWSDFYTGPVYDDTGWFLDLSGVDWGDNEADEEWHDGPAGPVTDPRRRTRRGHRPRLGSYDDAPPARDGWLQDGNAPASGSGATGRAPHHDYSGRPDGPGGGRGRHARPDMPAGPPGRRPDPGMPTSPGIRGSSAGLAPPLGHDTRYAPPAGPPGGLGTAPGTGTPGVRPQPPGVDWRPRPPGVDWRHPGSRPSVPGLRPAPGDLAERVRAAGRPAAGTAVSAEPTAESALVRSSGVMAVGTLVSRLSGMLRTLFQAYALGVALLAAAYNLSNTLPNVVYNLALGGILTSVIVPLIVNANKRDSDRGAGYDQRMFTLITLALAGVTLLAMALVVPIVAVYSGKTITGNTEHLAIIWALFFIPQIFFYGVSSLIAAILNSRGSFAAPMWTPIINNVVVIAVLGGYVAMAGLHRTPSSITGGEVQLLGFGTTLGIVAQTVALLPALRRVGFHWHPRLDFRRSEVREIGRMGGWMFCYIGGTQVAFLVTMKLAGDNTTGVSDYSYAWLLFQLPYAVVGISVITALLPRMSAHASERRFGLVRSDFSTGVRLASAIVVPCSLVLAVLGPSLGSLLFHGGTSPSEARDVGVVFAVFCLGLTPYMIFQLQLRVFYSLHDSKTPALIGVVTMTVNIVANLIALKTLPNSDLVAGLGAGFGLANLVGSVIAWRILAVRLRGLDGWRIGRSLVRMHAATLPAALIAVVVGMLSGSAVVTVFIGGGLALLLYVLFARALRIDELSNLSRAMAGRIGR
jgi:putative peptidoglycan lipid II flippase